MFDSNPIVSSHALQQDVAFRAALKLCGQNPVTLPSGLTLLSRRFLGIRGAMLPRATPPDDLHTQLTSVGLGRVPVIVSPETACANPKGMRLRPAMKTATLDLTPDMGTRRAKLHQKWRNQLCRAEDGPLRIKSTQLRPSHTILDQEQAQSRSRRYANWPRNLTAAFALAAPDQTRLFTAYLYGKPVADMLFLRHGTRATYHIGITTPKGRAHHAHNLLMWNATCWLADHGHTTLDLGLLHDETQNLNRFKLRTGAQILMTGGTWLRWHPFGQK